MFVTAAVGSWNLLQCEEQLRALHSPLLPPTQRHLLLIPNQNGGFSSLCILVVILALGRVELEANFILCSWFLWVFLLQPNSLNKQEMRMESVTEMLKGWIPCYLKLWYVSLCVYVCTVMECVRNGEIGGRRKGVRDIHWERDKSNRKAFYQSYSLIGNKNGCGYCSKLHSLLCCITQNIDLGTLFSLMPNLCQELLYMETLAPFFF